MTYKIKLNECWYCGVNMDFNSYKIFCTEEHQKKWFEYTQTVTDKCTWCGEEGMKFEINNTTIQTNACFDCYNQAQAIFNFFKIYNKEFKKYLDEKKNN